MCNNMMELNDRIIYESITRALDSSRDLQEFINFARGIGFTTIADSEIYLVMCSDTEDICVVIDKVHEYANVYICCETRAINI